MGSDQVGKPFAISQRERRVRSGDGGLIVLDSLSSSRSSDTAAGPPTDSPRGRLSRIVGVCFCLLAGLPLLGVGVAHILSAWTPLVFGKIYPLPIALGLGTMACLFGSLFLLGAVFAWRPPGSQRHFEAQQRQHPNQPWLWHSEWIEGRLRSFGKTQVVAAWVLALIVNLFFLPMAAHVIPKAISEGVGIPEASMGVFALLCLGLVALAAHLSIRHMKFGTSVLELAATPAVPGRPLRGRIVTRFKLRPTDGVRVSLMLVNRTLTPGSGSDRSFVELIHWREDRIVRRDLFESDPGRTAIPVVFDIPASLRPTDESCEDHQWLWKLDAKAAIPGVDYSVRFDVPVFATEPTPILSAEDVQQIESARPAVEPEAVPLGKIQVSPIQSGGVAIDFPRARVLKAVLILGAIAMIFGTVSVVLLLFARNEGLVLSPCFGLFTLLIGYVALDHAFTSIRVTIQDGRLVWERSMARTRREALPCDQIRDVTVENDGFVGNRVMYAIKLQLSQGAPFRIAGHMIDKSEADRLAALMREEVKKQAPAAAQ